MNNIWDVYIFIVKLVTDKYLKSSPTPDSIAKALGAAQQNLFDYYKALKEQGDESATTALAPFILTTPLTSNSSGLLAYPSNWADTELIIETIGGIKTTANPILDNELYEARQSALYPIAYNIRYQEQYGGIQLYPEATHVTSYKYLVRPDYPVIGYTVSGNTQTYDSATSVQLQFRNQYWNKIILLAMPYIGVNLSNADIASLGGLFNQPKSS